MVLMVHHPKFNAEMLSIKCLLTLLAAISCLTASLASSLSCQDEDGQFVDWFIAYKFPKLSDYGHPFDTGFSYAYITGKNDTLKQWTTSSKLITDAHSVVMRSMSVAYTGKATGKINSLYYNDGPPEVSSYVSKSASHSKAHAKGALIMDDITRDALWLTHSVSYS